MILDHNNYYVKKSILYAFLFAIFVSFFPWEALLPKVYFADRYTYKIMVESHFNKLLYDGYYDTFLSYFSNEWGWDFLLYLLYEKFKLSFDVIFLCFTFINTYMASIIITKYSKANYLPFLLNPWFFDFIYSQTRLALTISLFYLSFFLIKRGIRSISLLVLSYAILIHTSAILFLTIFIATYLIYQSKLNQFNKYVICLLLALVLSFILGPSLLTLLGALGDRRASEYGDVDFGISAVQLLPWYLIYFYISYRFLFRTCLKEYYLYYSILMLSLVLFSSTLFVGYAGRYLVVAYPIILLCLTKIIPVKLRSVFFTCYASYLIIGWSLRFFFLWR